MIYLQCAVTLPPNGRGTIRLYYSFRTLSEGSAYQLKCQSCSTCCSFTINGGKNTRPHSRFTRGTQLLKCASRVVEPRSQIRNSRWSYTICGPILVLVTLAGAAARVTWTDLLALAPGREDLSTSVVTGPARPKNAMSLSATNRDEPRTPKYISETLNSFSTSLVPCKTTSRKRARARAAENPKKIK